MNGLYNPRMDSATLEALVHWLGEHPLLAGGVIFLVAFCDAVVILGIAVPALPILFGVGTLVGLGHINGPYAVIAASLGAFFGDGISYVFGRHYGERLKGFWPFSKPRMRVRSAFSSLGSLAAISRMMSMRASISSRMRG